jgi:hypothetical protein
MDGMTDHDLLVEIRSDVRYIRNTLTDHEGRLRTLERQGDLSQTVHRLEETSEEHGGRLRALEKRDAGRRAVSSWKDMTLTRLIGLLGAAGGSGAVLGYLTGCLGLLGVIR